MHILFALLTIVASAKETKAPTAPLCEARSKELHHALKVAGRLLATPQENWQSADIDVVYDVLDKYQRAPFVENDDN